jgi:hypothetical protein
MRLALVLALVVSLAAAAPVSGGAGQNRVAASKAKAAGCVIKAFAGEGRNHSEDPVKYHTNPPTSGTHHPEWAPDRVFAAGDEPQVEKWVHSLEHGRVVVQYAPGTPAMRIRTLTSLVRERFHGHRGYHQLLFANNTEMPYAVAAVVWRRYLGCRTYNARVPDAVRAFRVAYVDRGPELIP